MKLISQQAAIEAVDFGITYAKAIDTKTGEVRELFKQSNEELRKAIERIKQLPSAQPDIIRCPDCRYNDGTAYCEFHFRDVKAKDYCSWAERRA